jgi:hypothetical protein
MGGCCDTCRHDCWKGGSAQRLCDKAWDVQIKGDFVVAIGLFMEAMEYGCPVAMVELGLMYRGMVIQASTEPCYLEKGDSGNNAGDPASAKPEEYTYIQRPDLVFINEGKALFYFHRAAMSGDELGLLNYADRLLAGAIAELRPAPFIDADLRAVAASDDYCPEEAVMASTESNRNSTFWVIAVGNALRLRNLRHADAKKLLE